MFENLTNKFEEALSSLKKTPSLDEKQVDDGLRNIRVALLESDVSLEVAKEFINRFLGPKFRRNFPDLEAEHHFWKEPNRRAMFVLHIGTLINLF